MKEIYRGHQIERDGEKIKVTSPEGKEWFEDSFKDAREQINEELEEQ